jgi:predicted phosphodiesterase
MITDTAPLLVFGGPYSNLQATEAMRAEAQRLAIPAGNVICTGDVVAYAAAPEQTSKLIRNWDITVVAGNCEEQLGDGAADCGCGFEEGSACDRLSLGWYPYALSHTSAASRAWMAGLPARLDVAYAGIRLCVLHGGANESNRFLFASQRNELEAEFARAKRLRRCDIVLAGHAGVPFISPVAQGLWVNSGVIGMPANDGTADVWYALIDRQGGDLRVALHRLAYDHVAAAADMRRSGHANGYARTLITGIWPSHDVLPPAELAATGKPIIEAGHLVRQPASA